MIKKVLSALLALILLCSIFAVPMVSADTESSYKKKLSNLAAQEEKYQAQLNEANADIENKEAYSEVLTGQIETLNEEISIYSSQISELSESIAEKQAIVDKANADVEEQMDALKNRLRAIYTAGETSDLEIILGAKSFSDFLDKIELVRALSEYDQKLIDKIQARLDRVAGEMEALETEKTELEECEEELQVKQEKLNGLLAENESVLAGLYQAKSDAKELLEEAQAKEAQIQSKLDAYYASLNSGDNGNNGDSGQVIVSGSGYTWPTPGVYYVISPFDEDRGYSHKGIDIAASMGTTVVAAEGGTVIDCNNSCTHNWGKYGSCGCGGGYGNYVIIDHGSGYSTIYGHLSQASVYTGQSVSKGQVIGSVGSTGWSTGAHLHFETRLYGSAYDPMSEY